MGNDKSTNHPDAEFKYKVRVSGTILDGNKRVVQSLMDIHGIGPQISSALIKIIDIDKGVKLGELSDAQIEKVENAIQNLDQYLPEWMLNHRNDYSTGKNIHLVGPDLEMANREEINRQKRIKSYIGVRHSVHLPVRGQRTRTSFRRGKTVGVSRRKR